MATAVLPKQQAKLLSLNDDRRPRRLPISHEGVRDVAGEPLLVGEAMRHRVAEPRDATKAVQAPTGQVGDVGHPSEGDEVMRADPMYRNARDGHQVLAIVRKALAQHRRQLCLIATKEAVLPKLAHPSGRLGEVGLLWIKPTCSQQLTNGALKALGVELACATEPHRRGIKCCGGR